MAGLSPAYEAAVERRIAITAIFNPMRFMPHRHVGV
jgi:hypothetical protein